MVHGLPNMPHLEITGDYGFYILVALIFVGVNAFFVAAEFALVKIRKTRLEILVKKGNPLARLAFRMVAQLDAYLSATQLGITLASLALGWIGEPAFSHMISGLLSFFGGHLSEATLRSVSLLVAFLFISALHIVLGELVPKSIALRTAEKICLYVAIPLQAFYILFFPFLWVLNGLSNFILRVIRVPVAGGPPRAHSEEEIKLIVEDSFEEGSIGYRKKNLLDRAFDFSDKTVSDIMVPAKKMVCFHLMESIEENLHRAKESAHTRFPLRENEEGRITGFIHMKDVIWHLEHDEVINLYDLSRPIIFFEGDTRLDVVLREFQSKKIHMGIVEEKNGRQLGLVTLEDVIEQIVGAIEDEFDK